LQLADSKANTRKNKKEFALFWQGGVKYQFIFSF